MDCSMPGFPDLRYLLEFAQTHVHCVHDAIQPSHPLLTPSSSAFNLSQHQGLFQWISSSNRVAKGLKLQFQSFQWIFRVDSLQDWLTGSPCSPRDSQESSPAPHFETINSLTLCLHCGPNLTAIHDQVHEILTKKKFFLKQKIPLRPSSQWLFPIGTVKIGCLNLQAHPTCFPPEHLQLPLSGVLLVWLQLQAKLSVWHVGCFRHKIVS